MSRRLRQRPKRTTERVVSLLDRLARPSAPPVDGRLIHLALPGVDAGVSVAVRVDADHPVIAILDQDPPIRARCGTQMVRGDLFVGRYALATCEECLR